MSMKDDIDVNVLVLILILFLYVLVIIILLELIYFEKTLTELTELLNFHSRAKG